MRERATSHGRAPLPAEHRAHTAAHRFPPRAELQREFAKKLLLCLKQGRALVLLCSNANPPLTSKLAHADLFPMG
jgi:hypothetical protein